MPLDPDKEKEWEYTITTPEGPIVVNLRMIQSSNINWVGWPKEGKERLLFVEFQDGARYVYADVSRQKAVALANAESTGKYLNERIKPSHPFQRIR